MVYSTSPVDGNGDYQVMATLLKRWMNKRQKMHWLTTGGHHLLPVRSAVLTLEFDALVRSRPEVPSVANEYASFKWYCHVAGIGPNVSRKTARLRHQRTHVTSCHVANARARNTR